MVKMTLLFYVFSAAGGGNDIITQLSHATGPTVLAVIVVGAMKEWWVPGPTHRRTITERDELLKLAINGQEVSNKSLDAAAVLAAAAQLRREQDADGATR